MPASFLASMILTAAKLAVLQVSCMRPPRRVMNGASDFSGRYSSASYSPFTRMTRSSATIVCPRLSVQFRVGGDSVSRAVNKYL